MNNPKRKSNRAPHQTERRSPLRRPTAVPQSAAEAEIGVPGSAHHPGKHSLLDAKTSREGEAAGLAVLPLSPNSSPSAPVPAAVQAWVRQLSRVFDQSPVSIVITDKLGRIEHVNPMFTRVTGYSPEEVMGRNPRILKSGEMPTEKYRQLWDTILAGGEWRGEFHNRKKNGKLYWESAAISPIYDDTGEITHFLALKEEITAHRQTERKLAEALNFNWNIISGTLVGIAVYNEAGQCVLANEAAAQIISGTVPKMLKQNFRKLASWRASGMLAMAEQALSSRQSQRGEFHVRTTFGKEVRLISSFSSFLQDDELHLLHTFNDITERKLAEKKLEMFQFASDQAADSVFWLDQSARITYANDEACRSLGYTREELCQMDLSAIDPTFSREQWAVAWKRFQSGEITLRRLESTHRRKDGTVFPIEVTAKHLIVDETEIHVVFVRDISERKWAEEKDRQQALLLDEATDAIWGLDLNGRISFWNKGAERIYGWSAAEAIGRDPLELMHCDGMTPQLQKCLRAVKEHGKWSGELDEITKDRRAITVYCRSNSLRDEQGRVKSLLIINTDITEKKRLEAQLLRSQRLESIGTLAGGIAHDLNNILTPLLFSVCLLRDQHTDEDSRKLFDTLESSIQRGVKLVKQVLAFGRGVKGERVPVQLNQVICEVEQIIQETFPKSVQLEVCHVGKLWNVKGDATQLHQVLLNLCVNARDAMPDGGKLCIHASNVDMDSHLASQYLEARPGPHVLIQVTDTGTGMTKQILERIFEPFFTTKELNKGTGLGLSTCRGIVKSHGGFIHCHSEPGRGSCFKVYLPASATAEAPSQSAPIHRQPLQGRNQLVLVVDDERSIREVTQLTLERFGYRVATASNGAEAVDRYRRLQSEIAVVLIDMSMPVMDGPTAIKEIIAINPDARIIGASGLELPREVEDDIGFARRHFLPKPFTGDDLLRVLNELLPAL